MISEGSCDPEDWSNDAKTQIYLTWINCILKYAQIDKRERSQIVIIFHNITVFAVFLIKQI